LSVAGPESAVGRTDTGGTWPLSRRQVAWIGWAIVLVAQAVLLPAIGVEDVPLGVQAVGLITAAVALVPLARWWARGERSVPMFELICAAYCVQFYQPLFHQRNQVQVVAGLFPLAWSTTSEALLLVALGVACLVVGHAVVKNWVVRLPKLDLQIFPTRRKALVVFALAVGITGAGLTLAGQLGGAAAALIRLSEAQLYVVVALLTFWGFRRTERLLWAKYLAVAVTGVVAVAGLSTGMLERAALPCVVFAIALWQVRQRFPWRWAVAGVVLLVALNAVKAQYRQIAWVEDPNIGLFRKLTTWVSLATTNAGGVVERSPVEPFTERLSEALFRFDLLHRFSYVVHKTPAAIPYFRGRTYKYLIVSAVPRIVWPSKPTASEANRIIDEDYGFSFYWQTSMFVVGIGLLPEAFANFGVAGIVVILLLQGAVFGLLDCLLNGPQSEGGRAIYLWTMAFFLNGIGSSAAILFGALLQNVLMNSALLRPFSSGFRAPAGLRAI
jgi:hypothetical protein